MDPSSRAGLLGPLLVTSVVAQAEWNSAPQLWGRQYSALVHDPQTGDVYAFGGKQNNDGFSEVWRFDGAAWHFAGPMPYGDGVEVEFDPGQNRFYVLYDSGGFYSWDRAAWRTEPYLPASGNPRLMLVRDPQRQLLIAVASTPTTTEVWAFRNGGWALQPAVGANPPWNANGQIALEPATGALLSLSAWSPTGFVPLTVWAWNGTNWQQRNLGSPAPAFEGFQLGRDPIRGDLLLWGGYRSVNGMAVPNDQMWAYDGASWRQVAQPNAPMPRWSHALADDTASGRMLLFGGVNLQNGLRYLADLWSWNGTAWSPVPFSGAPIAPGAAVIRSQIFDRANGTLVVFPADDQRTTMTFDGLRWRTFACGGACPADPFYLVADAHLPVPFAIAANGTFLWTGTSWAQFGGIIANLPMQGAAAWDGQRVIVFGGLRNGVPSDETWSWQAGTWSRLNPVHAPPPMAGHRLAAMPGRGVVLPTPNTTWWWDGVDWHDRRIAPVPPRFDAALTYLPERDRVVQHGGAIQTLSGLQPVAETWEWDGSVWTRGPDGPWAAWQHQLVEGPDQRVYHVPVEPHPLRSFGSRDPAAVAAYGAGCAGSLGVPALAVPLGQGPHLGTSFQVALSRVPGAAAALTLGLRADVWNGLSLPLDLGVAGMPGCAAWLAPEATLFGTAASGLATWTIAVPTSPAVLGVTVLLQGLAPEPTANVAGWVVSNALRARIGRL